MSTAKPAKRARLDKADFERLSSFRHRLRRFLRFSEELCKHWGLTSLQYQLLLHVRGFPGRDWASIGELAECLQAKHHGVVALINRCEKLGLVIRPEGRQDRRVVEIHLLPAGEALLERIAGLHQNDVWLAAEVWKAEKALPRAALTGAVVGALALTRTAAYYIGVVWVLAAVVGGRRWRGVAREFALLLLVQHAVMLPWAVRNHADIGRFTFLTTSSGMALFTGNNDHATGLWYPGWLDDLEASHPGIGRASVVERDDAAKKEAMRWMLGNPIRAVELYVSKLGWIFTEDRDAAEWTTNEAFWRPEATVSLFVKVAVPLVRASSPRSSSNDTGRNNLNVRWGYPISRCSVY